MGSEMCIRDRIATLKIRGSLFQEVQSLGFFPQTPPSEQPRGLLWVLELRAGPRTSKSVDIQVRSDPMCSSSRELAHAGDGASGEASAYVGRAGARGWDAPGTLDFGGTVADFRLPRAWCGGCAEVVEWCAQLELELLMGSDCGGS